MKTRNLEVLSLLYECHPKFLSQRLTTNNRSQTFRKMRDELNLIMLTKKNGERVVVGPEQLREGVNGKTVGQFLESFLNRDQQLELQYGELERLIQEVSGEWYKGLRKSVQSVNLAVPKLRFGECTPTMKAVNNTGAASPPNNQLLYLSHLKDLFDYYIRTHYKPHHLFDQIPSTLQKMDLTTWMIFNRDSNTLSILGKNTVFGAFKKYSNTHLLGFRQFYKAIKDVVLRIHPEDIEHGWRMLGVGSEESMASRLKRIGIQKAQNKSREAKERQFDSIFRTEEFPCMSAASATPQSLIDPKLRPPKKYSKLTIEKITKLKAKPHIVIPPSEPQDLIYLKEYPLNLPKQTKREFKFVVTDRRKITKNANYSEKALKKKMTERSQRG